MSKEINNKNYVEVLNNIKKLILNTRIQTEKIINHAMTITYWNIGKIIVEAEDNAIYGKNFIQQLSNDLKPKFGKAYDASYFYKFKNFYIWKKDVIPSAHSLPLSWSHYHRLIPLQDKKAANFYEKIAIQNGLSLSQMKSKIDS